MSDQPTCEQRVAAQLRGRIDDLEKLFRAWQRGEEDADPDLGEFHEYGLSFDYVAPRTFGEDQREGYFRYQLSWGGPSDEFRFFCNPDFTCYRVEYWFLDWFDGAHITLRGSREELMLEILEHFNECGTLEHQLKEAVA